MAETILTCLIVAFFSYSIYLTGRAVGGHKQRKLWERHMERANAYRAAVDDLDRWCGHTSPHARLIARHLHAHGEGLGYNGGTPSGGEACSVSGLRDQLSRIDAILLEVNKGGAA